MSALLVISVSLIPIALFVALLLWMDSFKLTNWRRLIFSLLAGAMCCALLYVCVTLTHYWGHVYRVGAMQEVLKGAIVYWMVRKRKIALLGDATIYGSAVAAGFSMMEAVFTLVHHFADYKLVTIWYSLLVGLQSAVMHIGCTSLLAMVMVMGIQHKFGREYWQHLLAYFVAFFASIFVHTIHLYSEDLAHEFGMENGLGYLPIIVMILVLLLYFIISKHSLFKKNTKAIHDWIDACINNDVALLGAIRKGELSTTNAGQYLLTLKDRFTPETFFDICCYISEYLELSIAAKSNLLLKEVGMPTCKNPQTRARLAELKALKKRIGRSGEMAVAPIVEISAVDKWVVQELV